MRIIYCLLLTAFGYTSSCGQNKQSINCEYFKVNNNDSICLDVSTNLDTGKVAQVIFNERKDVLLIFDGLVNSGKELLNSKNLKNELIRTKLGKLKIIRLYVDDRLKIKPGDKITIGEMNMLFQRHHFRVASQPYYVVVKKGKPVCNSGYLPNQEAIIDFFKRCQL